MMLLIVGDVPRAALFSAEESGHEAKLLVAGCDKLGSRLAPQLGEMPLERNVEQFRGAGMVGLGPADWFGDDVVNAAELLQVLGSDAHGLGGKFSLGSVTPHDGGTAFGRNHGVDGVLQHQHAVADGDGQGAARATLAGNDRDDRHLQARHLAQVAGDGFGLPAFFRAQPG